MRSSAGLVPENASHLGIDIRCRSGPGQRRRIALLWRQVIEDMIPQTSNGPLMSPNPGNAGVNGGFEVIDSAELAARLRVPESWVRNRTRARTPKEDRIPCLRFGHYVRFRWGSPELEDWLNKQRQ
jgi:hypothetical protein